jgi:hypothetical protein
MVKKISLLKFLGYFLDVNFQKKKKGLKIIFLLEFYKQIEALSTTTRIIYIYFNTILWNHEKSYNEN